MYMENLDLDMKEYTNLVDLLIWHSNRHPVKTCVNYLVDGETVEERLSYHELDKQARLIAAHLQNNAKQGERALLLYPPGIDFIQAFFGCLYAGIIAVPAYPPNPLSLAEGMSHLRRIAKSSDPSFILSTSKMIPLIEETVKSDTVLKIPLLFATDELRETGKTEWEKPLITKENLAFLQYTSGSTGNPRGVMITHENLIHNLWMILRWYDVDTEVDHCVSWLPPYHDMGLIGGILTPVLGGFGVTMMSPHSFLEKPFRWLKAVSRFKATITGGPNFAYDLCTRKTTRDQLAELDLSYLKLAVNGAEPVRPGVLERFSSTFETCGFRSSAFSPSYGLAENTLLSTSVAIPEHWFSLRLSAKALEKNLIAKPEPGETMKDVVCCGNVWADQQIEIVDPETYRLCSSDKIGEIWISSRSRGVGYWNQSQLSQKMFFAEIEGNKGDQYLRTGDLGFKKDGLLYVTGRIKDAIIIHGRNHYPQDIELTVEQSHSTLRQGCGASFAIDNGDEEQLVIVQEVSENDKGYFEKKDIVNAICSSVFEQHQLQVVTVVLIKARSIPKTSSGKIKRNACRDYFLNNKLDVVYKWQKPEYDSGDLSDKRHTEPISDSCLENWLIGVLSKKLQMPPEQLDLSRPLFMNGLDSLLIAEIQTDIFSEHGVDLPVAFLVGKNSISEICKKINQLKIKHPENLLEEEVLLENLDDLSEEKLDALLAITE